MFYILFVRNYCDDTWSNIYLCIYVLFMCFMYNMHFLF